MEAFLFVLVVLAAVPAFLFPICYAVIARDIWHRTPTGRALMISSTALAALLVSEIAFEVVPVSRGVEYGAVTAILTLIACGAWLKLGALLHEARHADRGD